MNDRPRGLPVFTAIVQARTRLLEGGRVSRGAPQTNCCTRVGPGTWDEISLRVPLRKLGEPRIGHGEP
jgi:hypothetical protein